ncbi:MAG: penicillin-binding transpeptidase domain-containing protein [Thermodesulfobacteriota bacterium]|nr:penicillin-binding transpeptidase domain-containing protein [Thermodesulfobacteriota bacterium]
MHNNFKINSWREFQTELKKKSRKKRSVVKYGKAAGIVAALFFIFYVTGIGGIDFFNPGPQKENSRADACSTDSTPEADNTDRLFTNQDLQTLSAAQSFINIRKKTLTVKYNNSMVEVETSLDMPLQTYILSQLEHLKTLTRGKPQRIGIVAMDPRSGAILAMAGFDLSDPCKNTCVVGNYPAASIFKIVTAAAAIEQCGYTPHTPLYFNGGKYTLYKRQISEKKNRYTNKVSFSKAFADSINPVFGKIGSLYLGGDVLKQYADSFGFNNTVLTDFSFDTGRVVITDKSYQWAEVGCGFNKTTTISPLFAAMVTSTIVNSGTRTIPWIVRQIKDPQGNLIYQKQTSTTPRAVQEKTAHTLMKLMNETIQTGTASKSFRGFKRDTTLSRLTLGGKTGSLYNRSHTVKYDWFTGFGREKNGDRQIAVAVIVGHRKYIGTRACRYGRMIFKQYFKKYFASQKNHGAQRG